ncbi:hypothetical protein [Flavobacterium lipolyticum]|uniref:Uncharacterized protein n=1 Tax=Flavobacterium lipolyticum TaxID=2893754 RepID=A0ABS8M4H1_9FLAO|nr:hypothetical protein [Flavobacterium sp. F-126]MCC9019687.1 hypothetical protein [Flavobacterium sp. F-126]
MKNEGFELSAKQLKVILTVVTIIFVIFLMYNFFILDNREKLLDTSLKNIQEENYQGFVINKNYDKDNHNSPMIYLKNETKVAVFGEFWSKIEIGDSIVKKKGETVITVYRNNEKFILDNQEIINGLKKK